MMNDDNGIMTWPDGDKYVGAYVDDKQQGYGVFTSETSGEYKGEW